MIHTLKENRGLTLFLLGGGVLLIIMAYFYLQQAAEIQTLEEKKAEVATALSDAEYEVSEQQAALEDARNQATIDATGLDPSVVANDREVAQAFFEPAFSWTNASEYNTVRDHYDESLGDGNSFTDVYLPEDVTIETEDGELSYIDHEGVRTQVGNMIITPLEVAGDQRIRYMAIVEFYMHLEPEDLTNTSALDASHAVIEFTVGGPEGSRAVSEVDAWSGFSSSVNE